MFVTMYMYKLYHGAEVYMDYIRARLEDACIYNPYTPKRRGMWYIRRLGFYVEFERHIMKMVPLSQNGSLAMIGLSRLAIVANEISIHRNRSEQDDGWCTVLLLCVVGYQNCSCPEPLKLVVSAQTIAHHRTSLSILITDGKERRAVPTEATTTKMMLGSSTWPRLIFQVSQLATRGLKTSHHVKCALNNFEAWRGARAKAQKG